MEREASIKLIAEGASRAAGDVRRVKDEVGGIEGVAQGANRALKDVAKALYTMATDAARAANDTKAISFGGAADSAKKFEESVTRLAVRTGHDVGTLKTQFRDVGVQIGVVPQRVAELARSLTKLTYSGDTTEAIKDLGDEANDTDRSLEEMAELGATLYNKLGVPMDKIGDAIRKVRTVANDLRTAGGHIALEDSLVRLGPLLSNFQGGLNRAAATVGVLGKGKSAQVAQETSAQVLGTLESLDPLLLTKKLREITGDRNYKPYTKDAAGRVVQKSEVAGLLQGYLRKRPRSAAYALFGRSRAGVQAAETFLEANLGDVTTEETRLELQEDAENARRARSQAESQHRGEPTDLERRAQRYEGLDVSSRGGNRFSGTAAGRRARTDVERGNVELSAGDVIQEQRDKRNQLYARHRGTQAAVDTVKGYLPPYLERAADLAEAAAVQGETYLRSRPASGKPERIQVDLSPGSVKGIADAIRSAPPVIQAPKGPAATAVEDSKARHRGGANF